MQRTLKIAAVDDLKSERTYLAEKIKSYMDSHWLKYELFQYRSGEAFVAALKKVRFDIVFMDIFIDGINGITCAGKLRERDMDCKLIFLTTSKDFLADGYAFNPCHYLVKPFADFGFEQAMENCRIKRQVDVPYIDIVSDSVPIRIDTTEIMYISTCDRTVFIHTTSDLISAGRGFIGISEQLLKDVRFLQCIKGVLINMDFVATAEESVFLMKNGDRLQIAVRERKNIIKQYRTYQFERASNRGRDYI